MTKQKEKIGLCSLRRESDEITIEVRIGPFRYTIYSVPENIIRCAIGQEDMEYLLDEQINPEWKEDDDPEDKFIISGRDESCSFSLTPTEFKDCMRYGDPKRDRTGSMDFEWVSSIVP